MGEKIYFYEVAEAEVTEILKKSHFSFQMGNYPIPVAEHSGHCAQLELYIR